MSGFQETLDVFLSSTYDSEDCAGPFELNEESLVPFAFQLWECVWKTFHKCSDSMLNVFTLLEAPAREQSKLHKK